MKKTIILFDMDGVLIHADGYHQALQSSVRLIGRNIGIKEPVLSKEQISHFEAAGVTHEWETLAICTAILLLQVWQFDGNIRLPRDINSTPENFLISGEDRFWDFLYEIDLQGKEPTSYAASILNQQNSSLTKEQRKYLELVLGSGIDINQSPTLRVFQEYVLGSDQYSQIYGFPSFLDTKSYLELYDRKVLTEENRTRLIGWLESDDCHAAIFTNRPSHPPEGFFSTPEAELGASAINLQDLPIVGAGSLSWLANLSSKPLDTYYKPSPVHVLSALQVAVGVPLPRALRIAADLYHGNYKKDFWLPFEGSKIIVFEDLVPGMKSAQDAREMLKAINVEVELLCVGLTEHKTKAKSLSQYTNCLIEDINEGILPGIIF
jgi:hypothetical protein